MYRYIYIYIQKVYIGAGTGIVTGLNIHFIRHHYASYRHHPHLISDSRDSYIKYVEYEPLLIAMDVVMLYPGAYRHLIFNCPQSLRRIIGSFVYVTLLEFYNRMYYLDDNLDPDVVLSAACWSAGASLAGFLIACAGKSLFLCTFLQFSGS